MKQYKVVTQKDKWFSSKFDPEKLEELINSMASQGWVLKSATSANVGQSRSELVIIFERDVQG